MIWIRNLLMSMQLHRKIDQRLVLIVFVKPRKRRGRKYRANLARSKKILIVIILSAQGKYQSIYLLQGILKRS